MENPSAEEIQNLFDDPEASNVEIRKKQAASTAVDVCHYYIDTNAVVQRRVGIAPRQHWSNLGSTGGNARLFPLSFIGL